MSPNANSKGILLPPCSNCRIGLPVRPAWIREAPRNWFCSRCGTTVFGVLNHDLPIDALRRIRGQALEIDVRDKKRPPQNVVDFLGVRNSEKQWAIEKRIVPRHATFTHCPVVPIDDQFRQAGEPFVAVVRNLSTLGISLIHVQRIKIDFLAIEFQPPSQAAVQIAVRVHRCRPFGPYFEIAGEFLTRQTAASSIRGKGRKRRQAGGRRREAEIRARRNSRLAKGCHREVILLAR